MAHKRMRSYIRGQVISDLSKSHFNGDEKKPTLKAFMQWSEVVISVFSSDHSGCSVETVLAQSGNGITAVVQEEMTVGWTSGQEMTVTPIKMEREGQVQKEYW